MNVCMLIGNVGKDPEVRTLNSGDSVAKFSLATTERWKDRDGEKQERTEWHNIVVFGKLANIVGDYVQKGMKVAVSGKITQRSWEDGEGQTKYITEIVLTQFDGKLEMLSRPETKKKADEDMDLGDDEDEKPKPKPKGKDKEKPKGKRGGDPDLDDEIPW